MVVKSKYSDCRHLDESSFEKIGCFPESEIHITKNKEYEAYAIASFKQKISLQIINDLELPSWLPICFFEVCDNSLPPDWICNFFDDEPKMVIGPSFIAKDIKSYNSMVELEPDAVALFWEGVKGCKPNPKPIVHK